VGEAAGRQAATRARIGKDVDTSPISAITRCAARAAIRNALHPSCRAVSILMRFRPQPKRDGARRHGLLIDGQSSASVGCTRKGQDHLDAMRCEDSQRVPVQPWLIVAAVPIGRSSRHGAQQGSSATSSSPAPSRSPSCRSLGRRPRFRHPCRSGSAGCDAHSLSRVCSGCSQPPDLLSLVTHSRLPPTLISDDAPATIDGVGGTGGPRGRYVPRSPVTAMVTLGCP